MEPFGAPTAASEWTGGPDQGIETRMALIPPLGESIESVRAILDPIRHDFSVAVYAGGNAFAVGAIIRVAHNYLAREVLIVGDAPFYEKASMGMEKYERVLRLPDADALFAHAAGRPVWALEKEAARRSLNAVTAFPTGVVLLLGSERFGLPESVIARCDDVLAIQIFGVNNSLPVAVAAGIAMNEWARVTYAGGRTI